MNRHFLLLIPLILSSMYVIAAEEPWHTVDLSADSWFFAAPAGFEMSVVQFTDDGMEAVLSREHGFIGYAATVIATGTRPVYIEADVEVSVPDAALALVVMNANGGDYSTLAGTFNVSMPLGSQNFVGTGTLSQLIAPEGGHIGIAVQAVLPAGELPPSLVEVTVKEVRYVLADEVSAEEFMTMIEPSQPSVGEPSPTVTEVPTFTPATIQQIPQLPLPRQTQANHWAYSQFTMDLILGVAMLLILMIQENTQSR